MGAAQARVDPVLKTKSSSMSRRTGRAEVSSWATDFEELACRCRRPNHPFLYGRVHHQDGCASLGRRVATRAWCIPHLADEPLGLWICRAARRVAG